MKILLIGLGSIGQRHLRNIKKIDKNVEIYAFRKLKRDFVLNNKNKIVGSNLKQKYHINEITNLSKINNLNLDAVFINTPSSNHLDNLELFIKNKLNIFIEKPLSDRSQKAKKYLNKINNIPIMIGHQLRFNQCLSKIKEIVDNDVLGTICGANIYHGESLKNFHIYEDYKKIYAAKKKLGGGVLLSQIHEIDYCNFLFGLPKFVYAEGGKISDLEIDVEDYVNILFKYHKNNKKFSVNMTLDYLQNPKKREVFITGTKGSLKWDYYKDKIYINFYNGKNKTLSYFVKDRNELFIRELKYFFECIKQKKELKPNFKDGYDSLLITEMIKKSIKSGKVVECKYD